MRIKKEVGIALVLAFLILFLGAVYYASIKIQNREKIIDFNSILDSIKGVKESPEQEVSEEIVEETVIEQPKEPAEEMPIMIGTELAVVEIKETKFYPTELEISVGTNVSWTNNDPRRVYQIYERSANQKFNSFRLAPGESYSYIFNESGTYYFNDAVFTYMSGVIKVISD